MAFKGGFLVKPTTTNTQNLANLLIQGTQAIEKKKMELDGIASDYMKETNKSVADIPINGPAGFPVLMTKSGAVIRQAQMKAYQDYKDGKIGIDDYKVISSKLNSEATIISKSGELATQRNEEVNKGVADGKLSGINSVLNHGIFRAASGSSNNETNVVPSIDPFNNLILTQSFFRPEVDGSTTPVSKTSSVSERLAPASGFVPYKSVDLAADIKTFKSNLGSSGIINTETQVLEDGSSIDVVKIDQSNDPKVQSAIETAIDTYLNDEDSLVDIAHKFGMKVDLDPSYKPYSKERISSKFGNDPLFNASGDTISISPEDMLLETSDNGIKVQLSDKQKDILAGHLRKQFYNSVGVTDQRFFMNRPSDTDKATTSKQELKKIPLQTSEFTRAGYSSLQTEYQKMYNKYANTTGDTLADNDLQEILTKSSTVANGMVIPFEIATDMKKNGVKASSFINKPINLISNIAGFKVGDKFYITVLGDTKVGEIEATIGVEDNVSGQAKSTDTFRKSMSSVLDDDDIRNLFGYLLRNNDDFAEKAKTAGYDTNTTDVAEAMYTIMDMYSLVPAK